MKIRQAFNRDLETIMNIYADAKAFMRLSGNNMQWQGNYPQRELIVNDIKDENCYICEENGEILAVFCFFEGEDPTYLKIYDGKWLSSKPYGVIHRIAVSKNAHGKGVAAFCYDFCFSKIGNIKIDTHRDNIPMQKSLLKYGFTYCGIIYLKNGEERLAYQKENINGNN